MTQVKKTDVDVLVLGGGWSGLLTAFLYARQKKGRVLVLEKESVPGGLARTMDIQGLKADIGGHALFFKKPENIAFLKEIVQGPMLLLEKRKTRIYIDGKYLHYPANFDFIWNSNKKYLLSIAIDFLKVGKRKKLSNFEDWVKSNYGETLYALVFREYSQKVWGMPCNRLSYSWADARIGKNGLVKFFLTHFLKESCVKERSQSFLYPRQGIGELISALLSRRDLGFLMMTDASLNGFSRQGARLSSLQYSSKGVTHDVHFKQLVSTIPLTELLKAIPLVPGPIVKAAREGIRFRSLMVVYLVLDRALATDWSWCYYPSDKLVFSRIHEPKFWSRSLAPEGKTLLSVEIFCDAGDRYWEMPDPAVVAEVQDALKMVGLLLERDNVVHAQVTREKHAYPLLYCGFESSLRGVTDYLKSDVNLHLAGRNGTHSYFDMEECLDDVRNVVHRLVQDGGQ